MRNLPGGFDSHVLPPFNVYYSPECNLKHNVADLDTFYFHIYCGERQRTDLTPSLFLPPVEEKSTNGKLALIR